MKASSSKTSIIVLLALLIAVLLFAIYYYVISPKKEEAEALESSVNSIKSEISSIQNEISQIEESQKKSAKSLAALRRKVPDSREIDKLILNIEEIEYATGSRILGIDFNNYDQKILDSSISKKNSNENQNNGDSQNTNNDAANNAENTSNETTNTENNTNAEGISSENGNNENNNNQNGNQETQPVSDIANLELPSSLKIVTLVIEFESPTHEQLVKFVRELEKLERIMHVDLIEYELPGEEQEFEDNPKKTLDAKVQITTFYYDGK